MIRKKRVQRKKERLMIAAGSVLILALALCLHLLLNVLGMPLQGAPSLSLWEVMPQDPGLLADEDDQFSGWVELHNTTTQPISLAGYALTDDMSEPHRWQFPDATIDAGERRIVFLSGKDRAESQEEPWHASFELPAQTASLYLIGGDGVIKDQLNYEKIPPGVSLGRDENQPDSWLFFPRANPGNPNESEGYSSLDFEGIDADSPLFISELMASNRRTLADEDGDYRDWIEIFNPTDDAISLQGYRLSDDVDDPAQWVFPDMKIAPQERLVVFASGKDRRDPDAAYLHTNFRINRSEDILLFSAPEGQIIEQILIRDLPPDVSMGKVAAGTQSWRYFTRGRPGEAQQQEGIDLLDFSQHEPDSPVHVNELMASNQYTLQDEDKDYPDWIELYNDSDEPIDLAGYFLSDDSEEPLLWKFPQTILQPGEHRVVFASGKDRRDAENGPLHTNFRINRTRDVLYFRSPEGHIIDRIEIEDHLPDVSYGRDPENIDRWLFFTRPNPGQANESHGHESLSEDPPQAGRLFLSEVMSMNLSTLTDDRGQHPNWIELYNAGDEAIDLAGFGLSDRPNEPMRWRFPQVAIDPGERLVVYASGEDHADPENKVLHTNFGVSTLGSPVLLSDPVGRTIDKVRIGRLPEGISVGRRPGSGSAPGDWAHFTDPSPGQANEGRAYEGITKPPKLKTPGGFYDDSVQVSLENPHEEGTIRYTLDGSVPDENATLYTEPIHLEETAVLRAQVFRDDWLSLHTTTQTFFIDEEHVLPVVSIAIDPFDFEDPVHGLHSMGPNASSDFPYFGANFHQDWERPAHFEYYETSGRIGYELDIGFKVFGSYSRGMDQKSFAVYARNRYEYDTMTYPFLDNKDLLHYKHLVLRTSGQDATRSKIRDMMMTSLAAEETNLDVQGYRQSILYINGRYWGIYNIREKINRYYIQNNHDMEDLDGADILEGNARTPSFFKSGDNEHYDYTVDYITRHDMNDPEHYAYVDSIVDLKNFADYWSIQMIIGNSDTGNIRYWRERSDDGKWRWILYDLDWGFYFLNHNSVRLMTHPQGHGHAQIFSTRMIRGLLQSDDFQELFLQRMAHHLNVTFETQRVIDRIDELAATIAPEIPRSTQRWAHPASVDAWEDEVEDLRDFARRRPIIIARQIQEYFRLSDQEMQMFDVWPDP